MKKIIKIVIIFFVVLFLGTIVYLGLDQYKPSNEVLSNIERNSEKISETKDYILFDSDGDEKAVVIYPGAKVDSKAYGNIALGLMENDIDVYILKYPFNFALINITKADKVLKDTDYQEIYLAGHSLGGSTAAMHVNKHQDEFEGLILLASYSTAEIPDNVKTLLICGTNDQVINTEAYTNNLINLPDDYVEEFIEGGNHGQFGSYGFQKGDGVSSISEDEQKNLIVNIITNFINE